ncbi:MAG: hypothetical protein KFW21_00815 [Spirochaetota bacterium]|nr:hypothetical protein [Spirochaetota bacterium]
MNYFIQNTKKIILLLVCFISSSCNSFNSNLVKDGDVYLFQGKEQVIVSFVGIDPTIETLDNTAKIIAFLKQKQTKELSSESVLIEGLTDNIFYNFHVIGEALFFVKPYYQNKTLIYGYIASLYADFSFKNNKNFFIPLQEFQKFIKENKIPNKDDELLMKVVVDFAINEVFFVSVLELLERPQRYFYSQKTQEELYQTLIYPEILGFWNYLVFRFGRTMLLKIAQEKYTPESWHVLFGEETSELEAAYVKNIKDSKKKLKVLSNEEVYKDLTNSLQLYMTGTKKSLMTE